MSKPWFVRHAGKVHGPFDDAQVQALVSAGKINPATEVANSSGGPWHKAAGVLRHFASPHMHGGHPPSTVSAPSVSPQSTVIGSGNHQHSRVPPPPLKPAISPMRDSGKPARAPQSHPPDSGLALPTILSPPRHVAQKPKSLWAKAVGGVGGFVGLCILLYNVSVVFYNGYLRTDAAAIGLLKTSMQESFEEDATTAKPVKVLDVRLEGKGVNRTGSAVVMLAGERKLLPFEATVKKSGRGVEVSWEIVESLPRSQPQTETLKSQRAPSASPSRTSQPSVRQSGAAQPSVPHTDRDYKRHLQALLETASAIDTTEIILLGGDSELDDAKVNQQLDKLREAWTAMADEAEWLVQALKKIAMTTPLDDDALQFQKQLGEISVIYPAVKAAIQGARATSDSDEYDAHMQTYGNLTSQLSIRGESEGAGEDVQ